MSNVVEVKVTGVDGFAENKDDARTIRKTHILPALRAGKRVVINFDGITSSTQSFVHALIGEPLQKDGESVLNRLEFRSCAQQIKSLVELVVDYSLSGFGATPPVDAVKVGTGADDASKTIAERAAPRTKKK
jgi:STAS-like domain of unknown function (DUF4325)